MSITPARRPDPILVRSALLASRTDRTVIDHALRRGTLLALFPGLYVDGTREVGPLDRARAAVMTVHGCDAVAAGRTAARVWDLEVPPGGPEEVTIPRAERRANRAGLLLRTATLGPGDVVEVAGVPITSPARTLVDLCRSDCDRVRAVFRVERALRRDLVTRAELETALENLRRAPRIVRAREWIDSADARSDSPVETDGRLSLIDAGLPTPELQIPVRRLDGRMAYLDLGWRRLRVGVEFDGRSEHGFERAVFDDRQRENQIVAVEWRIFRFSGFDVRHRRSSYVATLASALGHPLI